MGRIHIFPPGHHSRRVFRILFFTCAAAARQHRGASTDALSSGNLPTAIHRNRLMRRALTFQPLKQWSPTAIHVYWDLHTPKNSSGAPGLHARQKFQPVGPGLRKHERDCVEARRRSPADRFQCMARTFQLPPRSSSCKTITIISITTKPSMEIVTFPAGLVSAATRASDAEALVSGIRYPTRIVCIWSALGLPVGDSALSESWGTIRYGRLAEVLLYDVRRVCTLAGPSAVFIDPEVESWLLARSSSPDVTHVVHAPSNPLGWTAGKWMEWYPDVLNREGRLTTKNRTKNPTGTTQAVYG